MRSPEETIALGIGLGQAARSGHVLALSGDLGAGKTQLVRGIARGLGALERVHSPTFALLNEYASGRLRLFHLDLYRLQHPEEVIGAGLDIYLIDPPGFTVLEWPERWFGQPDAALLPPNVRWLHLEILDESSRSITHVHSRP